jgi:hypothetical protein
MMRKYKRTTWHLVHRNICQKGNFGPLNRLVNLWASTVHTKLRNSLPFRYTTRKAKIENNTSVSTQLIYIFLTLVVLMIWRPITNKTCSPPTLNFMCRWTETQWHHIRSQALTANKRTEHFPDDIVSKLVQKPTLLNILSPLSLTMRIFCYDANNCR